jgi:hypothetical protein
MLDRIRMFVASGESEIRPIAFSDRTRRIVKLPIGTKLALPGTGGRGIGSHHSPSRDHNQIQKRGCSCLRTTAIGQEESMTERGTDGAGEDGNRAPIQPDANEAGRLGNPTRLVPRQEPTEDDSLPVTPRPAVVEDELEGEAPPSAFGRAGFGPMFGPRSFGNGRIQVWGCSPGCLVVSLIASVVLTILLNALF